MQTSQSDTNVAVPHVEDDVEANNAHDVDSTEIAADKAPRSLKNKAKFSRVDFEKTIEELSECVHQSI